MEKIIRGTEYAMAEESISLEETQEIGLDGKPIKTSKEEEDS